MRAVLTVGTSNFAYSTPDLPSAAPLPVAPTVEQSPTVSPASAPVGSNFTFTEGTYSGTSPITVSGVLTQNGVDVTDQMVGLTFTSTAPGPLVWTVNATNIANTLTTTVSSTVEPLPVAPTVQIAPTASPASAPVGSNFTFTEGTYSGTSPISVSGVLTQNGVNVTDQMVGLTFTSTATGPLVWTVTASNIANSVTTIVSSTIIPLPVAPTVQIAPTTSPASAPVGSNFTFTEGTYSGTSPISVSGVLTQNGVDVTNQMVGLTFTSTEAGPLVWTVTATNTVDTLTTTAYSTVESLPEFDIYVDNNIGNDQNPGTEASPIKTLAEAKTRGLVIGNGVKFGWAAGSVFHEDFVLENIDNVTIGAYGDVAANGLPIARGDEVMTGVWQNNTDRGDAFSNTYSMTWEHFIQSDQTIGGTVVFQSGSEAPLSWQDTQALVDVTPGSYTHDGQTSNSSPVTVYIHPRSSTNPNTDGNIYEATKRSKVISLGNNAVVRGIEAKRAGFDDGAVKCKLNALVDRCFLYGGPIHDALINSGKFLNCHFWHDYASTHKKNGNIVGAIVAEGYANNGIGLTVTWEGCTVKAIPYTATSNNIASFGGHTDGTNFYDKWNVINCAIDGGVFGGNDVNGIETDGLYLHNAGYVVDAEGVDPYHILKDVRVTNSVSQIGIKLINPGSPLVPETNGRASVSIDGLRIGLNFPWQDAVYMKDVGPVTLNRSVFYDKLGTSARHLFRVEGVGPVTATGNAFYVGPEAGNNAYTVAFSGMNWNGSNNVYSSVANKLKHTRTSVRDGNTTQVTSGIQYTSSPLWLSQAQGQNPVNESGSVAIDPVFVDPANQNFTLVGTVPANSGLERPNFTYLTVPQTVQQGRNRIVALMTA